MSVAAIRTAVAALLAGITAHGGLGPVYEETGTETEHTERTYNGRVHWWEVHVSELPPAGGVGYLELRHRVRVEGYLGVSSDDPTDGIRAHDLAGRLLSSVVQTLATGTNITVTGTALGSEAVTPDPIVRLVARVDGKEVQVLRMAVTYTVLEDA